jgi:thioredoxin reductase
VNSLEYELIIIGGGPAGLSAALSAGRACVRTLLIDSSQPRNSSAHGINNFLSRDGIAPAEFRQVVHAQMQVYPSVEFAEGRVEQVTGSLGDFQVHLDDGRYFHAKFLLLALGLIDELPAIDGLADYWGSGIHHCPYCDGFSYRDKRWGLLAHDVDSIEYAIFLKSWTKDITFFAHGLNIPEADAALLRSFDIALEQRSISRILGRDQRLSAVELEDGSCIHIAALWIQPRHRQHALIEQLQLTLNENGSVARDSRGETSTRGIYAAGDIALGPPHQAILAAADGTRTGCAVNREIALGLHTTRSQRQEISLQFANG